MYLKTHFWTVQIILFSDHVVCLTFKTFYWFLLKIVYPQDAVKLLLKNKLLYCKILVKKMWKFYYNKNVENSNSRKYYGIQY